jgi:hypothetical protein
MCYLIGVYGYIVLIYSWVSAPLKVDETDIGNKDPALEHTYKGLPKLRCVQVSYHL